MNTPPVDAEGVFFLRPGTRADRRRRPAARARKHDGERANATVRRPSAHSVWFYAHHCPRPRLLRRFCGTKQAGILQVATRKKIPPKY